MQRITFLICVMISAALAACPDAQGQALAVMSVPNVREAQPACSVTVHLAGEQCADASCILKPIKGSKQAPPRIAFSCIPLLDQSGFENPSPEMKLTTVKYQSGTGDFGIIDAAYIEGEKPAQDILFCLTGTVNYLCGNARVDKVKGRQSPEVTRIQRLIERIEFNDRPAP